MCLHCHVKNSWWEAALQHRELSSMLCDGLEGRDREWGGGDPSEKRYMYTYS